MKYRKVNEMKSTFAKVGFGFILGSVVVGGVATAAGTFTGSNVVKACVDNKTNAIYATATGSCPVTRTLVTLGAPAASANTTITSTTSINPIVQKVAPTVVTVTVTTAGGGATGSGSILQTNATSSYIITNNHVIADAVSGGTVTVELDNGDEATATIVGRDVAYDLAVLKINVGNLPTLPLGDSSSLNIGDQVIAFGSPLGLDRTVTSGIVSALNRPVTTGTTGAESYVDAIQTDAAINPGNSGGALTDSQGRIVGVNSAIASMGSGSGSIGLGFSIPINEAKRVFDEIIKTGKSTRPVLGVYFDTTYTGKGAKISSLATASGSSPAANAGIPAGSIVTAIDGVKIPDQTAAIVKIRSYIPGTTVKVTVTLPTGGSKTFSVVLGSATSN